MRGDRIEHRTFEHFSTTQLLGALLHPLFELCIKSLQRFLIFPERPFCGGLLGEICQYRQKRGISLTAAGRTDQFNGQ